MNFKICVMFHKYKYIFLILFLFKANTTLAQSVSSNVTIISSPEKTVAASAQSGANTLQVINSYGLGLASTINLSWLSLALGLAVVSVWDGDSGGSNNSPLSPSHTETTAKPNASESQLKFIVEARPRP